MKAILTWYYLSMVMFEGCFISSKDVLRSTHPSEMLYPPATILFLFSIINDRFLSPGYVPYIFTEHSLGLNCKYMVPHWFHTGSATQSSVTSLLRSICQGVGLSFWPWLSHCQCWSSAEFRVQGETRFRASLKSPTVAAWQNRLEPTIFYLVTQSV